MDFFLNLGLTNALTAAALALAAAVIARFSRRPALWYTLWLVVLLRLLVPPIFAVDLPIPDLGRAAPETGAAVVAVSGGAVSLADSGLSLDPLTIIAVVWSAGALVVIGFAIAQSVQLRQILAASEPASRDIANRVATLSNRLGLRRAPPAVQVADRVPPMLWAFLGSVRLILPIELLARLDDDETDTLLAHELAHLSRRDHWVRHLELAALALFWWNPVAWWTTGRVRRAQELCCDQRVAGLLPHHRRAYADCLVETARFLSGRQLPLGSPARAMADLSQMKGRIQMIMTTHRARDLSLAARITAAAILLAVLAITPVLTAQPDRPDAFGRPISLSLKDADLLDVLATFSEISAVEILVEPGISGTVTATFDEVPWDQALDKIAQSQGLICRREGDQIIVRRAEGEHLAPVQPTAGEPPTRLAGKLDGAEVFRYVPDGRITEPVAIDKIPPKYPPEAREAGIMGIVVADLVIDEVGMVRDVVIQESPSDELSLAAIEAFEQWRFKPAMMDGEAVAVRYMATVKFKLQ
jgi:TonB family protein